MTTQKRKYRSFPKPVPKGSKMSALQRILRRYRVRRGLSRLALAEASGTYHNTIKGWETDSSRSPQIYHVSAVLDALDLELWVINRDDGKLVERIY